MCAAHQAGVSGHQCVEVLQTEFKGVRVDLPHLDHHAALPQTRPGPDISLVVSVGHNDLVSRTEARGERCSEVGHQLSRAGTEHDFPDISGIDQAGHRTGALVHPSLRLTRRLVAGTELYAGGQQVIAHLVGHAPQHLRSSGIVEVGPGRVKSRKLRAYKRQMGGECVGVLNGHPSPRTRSGAAQCGASPIGAVQPERFLDLFSKLLTSRTSG